MMQETPLGFRKKIVFVGQTNVGKSALINAIVGMHVSITSDIKGTTTDSVSRAFEILDFGPVQLYDTAGFGDASKLGTEREKAARATLQKADLAILVVASVVLDEVDKSLLMQIENMKISHLIVYNKNDLYQYDNNSISTNTLNNNGIKNLIQKIKNALQAPLEQTLLGGIVKAHDKVLLVMPQDASAPKGRLILPQVQMLRELIDLHALPTCIALEELELALSLQKYDLVITDSQVVKQVLERLPATQKVSTFSVLFARMKGNFDSFLQGLGAIDTLQDNDKILIVEACHHTTKEDDIAKNMIPKLLQNKTGKNLIFENITGDLPSDLTSYKLILQCGGCMLTPKEVHNRIHQAHEQNVPMTNFGLVITKCQVGDVSRLTY